MHFIDISLEFGTAESLFVFCRIGANTRRNGAFGLFGTALTKLVRPGLTNLVQAVPDLADSHLVRPSRTTLVRAVHRCHLTDFKSWQRLFIAGYLSIFEDSIPDQIESSEKERKGAKEQGEKKKEEEEAKIDESSSSHLPIFDLVLSWCT